MLPRKFCEYKESNKCSAVVPDCVCGRDAAKKVRDAENKVKKLKKEVDELKKQPDAAAQMGGEISKWATTWLHDNAVTSQVFHGGDWQGNSCRDFLRRKENDDSKDVVYVAFIKKLCQKIDEIPGDTQAKQKQKEKLITFLNGIFKSLCDKLVPVVSALSSTEEFTDQQCDNAAASCKEYVRYYREQRDNINKVLEGVNVKPKLHVLETHVVEWYQEWRSVGFFGEDVVESLHAVINKHQRIQSSSFARDKRKYYQTVDDELNLLFEQFACAPVDEEAKPKRKKRKKGEVGTSATSSAGNAAAVSL